MRFGKEAACVGAGLALCLLLGGCVGLGDHTMGAPRDPRGFTPAPRPSPVVPDLRLPGDPAQAKTDIPIVPLPIPPADRSPVQPAAFQKPPAPPVPPTTEPGPALNPPPGSETPMPPARETGMDSVRRVYKLAVERYDGMDSYIARLTRHEQVRGDNKPEEVMLFKFRKEPWSVYFKWLGPTGRGREALFVNGQYENKIQTLLAAGDMPLAPAGKRMSLAPDSILVRSTSRHPITEAGLGATLIRLGRVLDSLDRGDQRRGTLIDLGMIPRPEFAQPVAAIEHHLPPGYDPNLPRGGRTMYCFDPDNHLPVLIVVRDHAGQEVEYYYYDRLQFPVRLDDGDFNPDKLWSRPVARP
jgi:hypothetical protein